MFRDLPSVQQRVCIFEHRVILSPSMIMVQDCLACRNPSLPNSWEILFTSEIKVLLYTISSYLRSGPCVL